MQPWKHPERQRDAGQLVIGEILDAARIPRNTHQVIIMHHYDFAVGGHLQVELNAVTGLASGSESG